MNREAERQRSMLNLLRSANSRLFWMAIGLGALGGVGYLDLVTGYEIELNLLYAIPVLVVTWFTSWRLGLALAVLSPIMLLVVRSFSGHSYSRLPYYVWNPLLKCCILAVLVYLVWTTKKHVARANDLARVDGLTGAVNRRCFMTLVQGEIDRARRYQRVFTLVYMDIDDFKVVNDRGGHTVGDRVLQTLVAHARRNVRKVDVVARLGGDEFALLLPETGQESARIVVAKIRQGILDEMQEYGWGTTLSIGVVTCIDVPHAADEIVRMADDVMYSVKRRGKNAVSYVVCGCPASPDQGGRGAPPPDGAWPRRSDAGSEGAEPGGRDTR